MKKVFISVGEVSGDAYTSHIVRKLSDRYTFIGIAGKKMMAAGVKPVATIDNISVVGVIEALSKYSHIRKVFRLAIDTLNECDTLIAVDFPGFNIKLIQQAKKMNKKVIYFISPQIWAWHYSRIYTIVKNTDLMISILPFEEEYYRPFVGKEFQFKYFGHPLLDIVKPKLSFQEFITKLGIPPGKKLIGLLPGSRESEVVSLLPVMLQGAKLINTALANTYFLIPVTDNTYKLVVSILSRYKPNIPLMVITSAEIENPSYEVMEHSVFSVIASGTATLEASIIGNPFVLVYKVNPITFLIGSKVIKVSYLGLPNLIAGRQLIPELLQDRCSATNIANTALRYLLDSGLYDTTKQDLATVRQMLGQEGAIDRIAQEIDRFISRQQT